jgi:ribosome-associated translation inhibitor RaiA
MSPSRVLFEHLLERSRKLGEYFHGQVRVVWNLSTEHLSRVVRGHVVGGGIDCFAVSANGDFIDSIDEAVEKLEKQIRRRREAARSNPRRAFRKSSHSLRAKYLKTKEQE